MSGVAQMTIRDAKRLRPGDVVRVKRDGAAFTVREIKVHPATEALKEFVLVSGLRNGKEAATYIHDNIRHASSK
jgi:hypothetical protein